MSSELSLWQRWRQFCLCSAQASFIQAQGVKPCFSPLTPKTPDAVEPSVGEANWDLLDYAAAVNIEQRSEV